METLWVTSAQSENGVLVVRRRDWDLNLFIFFVLNEKSYWKKKPFVIEERLLLKLSNNEHDGHDHGRDDGHDDEDHGKNGYADYNNICIYI